MLILLPVVILPGILKYHIEMKQENGILVLSLLLQYALAIELELLHSNTKKAREKIIIILHKFFAFFWAEN